MTAKCLKRPLLSFNISLHTIGFTIFNPLSLEVFICGVPWVTLAGTDSAKQGMRQGFYTARKGILQSNECRMRLRGAAASICSTNNITKILQGLFRSSDGRPLTLRDTSQFWYTATIMHNFALPVFIGKCTCFFIAFISLAKMVLFLFGFFFS